MRSAASRISAAAAASGAATCFDHRGGRGGVAADRVEPKLAIALDLDRARRSNPFAATLARALAGRRAQEVRGGDGADVDRQVESGRSAAPKCRA